MFIKMTKKSSEILNNCIVRANQIMLIINFFATIILIISLGVLVTIFFFKTSYGIKKSTIKKLVIEIVKNKGNIREIETIYNRELNNTEKFPAKKVDEYYPQKISLIEILQDIKVDELLNESKNHILLDRIDKTIVEFYELNPFDKLERNQIPFFNNIRMKLNNLSHKNNNITHYKLIEEDIANIISELAYKNKVVTKYLNKSEQSFYLAIVSILLSISSSIYQLALTRKKN